MNFSIKENCVFERNHVIQGEGFVMSVKVNDGQEIHEAGKTFYNVEVDNPLSGGLYFESFAQLRQFSQLLSDFCADEKNVLVGRDYERYIVEQVKKIRISRKKDRREKRRNRRKKRDGNAGS